MLRLFVGLDLPEEIRDGLPMADGEIAGCRWMDDDALHLTLRFIGEVDHAMAGDIDDVLARLSARAFPLTLHGLDVFGGRRPHTLYAGVRPCPPLIALHQKIDGALTRLGAPAETRRFVPHVTLARLRDAPEAKIASFIQAHNLFEAGPFTATAFNLYSSRMHPDGSVYTIERSYPLN